MNNINGVSYSLTSIKQALEHFQRVQAHLNRHVLLDCELL